MPISPKTPSVPTDQPSRKLSEKDLPSIPVFKSSDPGEIKSALDQWWFTVRKNLFLEADIEEVAQLVEQNITIVQAPSGGGGIPLHDHDDRYYRESEVDSLLSGKSNVGHNHDAEYIAKDNSLVLVYQKSDFPAPSAGVITLVADTTYFIFGTIDLTGDRLVGGSNTCLIGASSENSILTSTGLSVSTALFTTAYTTAVRHIAFKDVGTALAIDGTGNSPALDWTGVNFVNVPTVGIVENIDNFIFTKGALLNSKGWTFDGTAGTISFNESIFAGDGAAGALITVAATANVSRRFRLVYSSVVAFGSTTGLDISSSATIPVEGYILDTINFSGGSTYMVGVQYNDNKALVVNCKGVNNSAEIGNYYMLNNATVTTISATATPTKVAGTTTANSINQKFTHTNNRLTYTGVIVRDFQMSVQVTLNSTNNNDIGLYVAKNGTEIPESEMYVTTDGAGKASAISIQGVFRLSENDYVEVFVENNTGTNNITVEYLNAIIKSLN